MKTIKKIPLRYLVVLMALFSLGATYSARSMLEIGPTATITGASPTLQFLDSDTEHADWEMEANHSQLQGSYLEISPKGTTNGFGKFKIFENAKGDALTVAPDGNVIINRDSGAESELTVFGGEVSDDFIAVTVAKKTGEAVQFGLQPSDNTFFVHAGEDAVYRNKIIQGALAAPEDALTILGRQTFTAPISPVVRVGIPFSEPISDVGSIHIDQKGLLINSTDTNNYRNQYLLAKPLFPFEGGFGITEIGQSNTEIPLIIEPGTTTGALMMGNPGQATSNIGMGLRDPDASLHLFRDDGSAVLRVEEASATTKRRKMFELINNGPSKVEMTNTDTGRTWSLVADFNDSFNIRQNGPDTANFAIRKDGTFSFNNLGQSVMALKPNGNANLRGVLNENSDRTVKENFTEIDSLEILDKVIDLPLCQWNYIKDESDTPHFGPMAQDFHAAFGLGDSNTSIATLDTSGVALAAVKGLNQKLEAKVASLTEQNSDLLHRMEQLEQMVESLTTQ